MMPVEQLPPASALAALSLGFVSAVFDNIPLTALALKQGGYDWGFLAYAVGFGGSMIWFGSSAGVAVSNLFPEAKSVGQWLRHGWFIPIGYVYPSRTTTLQAPTLVLTALWLASYAVLLAQHPDPSTWVLVFSIAYVAYYVVLSLYLTSHRSRTASTTSTASTASTG